MLNDLAYVIGVAVLVMSSFFVLALLCEWVVEKICKTLKLTHKFIEFVWKQSYKRNKAEENKDVHE